MCYRPIRLARAALVPLVLVSCTYWKTETAPQLAADTTRPHVIRLLRPDGSGLTLTQARLVNDTLVGLAETGDTTRAPVSQPDQLQVRSVDGFRTALLVGYLMGSVVAAATYGSGF